MCEEVKRGDLFSGEPGIAGSLDFFLLFVFGREPWRMSGTGFLPGRCPSFHPTDSVRALW